MSPWKLAFLVCIYGHYLSNAHFKAISGFTEKPRSHPCDGLNKATKNVYNSLCPLPIVNESIFVDRFHLNLKHSFVSSVWSIDFEIYMVWLFIGVEMDKPKSANYALQRFKGSKP